MQRLSEIDTALVRGRRCLLRINLDLDKILANPFRLAAAVPTVKFLKHHGAAISILSHRGRPTKPDPDLSLKNFMEKLEVLTGEKLDWLENLRFDPREEENDEVFAQELARQGDFYVNDDFASSHRLHASLSAIKKFLPSYLGLLVEQEIAQLDLVLKNPKRPLIFIIGGSKVEEKKKYAEEFRKIADKVLLGSLLTENPTADIDEGTANRYAAIVKTAGTVVWNGPLGDISQPETARGTKIVLEAAAAVRENGAFVVLGGGSLADFTVQLGFQDKIGFLSTGGGAMLAFLTGKPMPGLEIPKNG